MTKQKILNLRKGEHAFKFTNRDMQLIGACLKHGGKVLMKIAEEVQPLNNPAVVRDLVNQAREVEGLQFAIENGDHDV